MFPYKAHSINLETMTLEPAEAGRHQEQKAAALVPQLQLTEQQLEVIPVGMRLYYDLLAAIHQVCGLILCVTLSHCMMCDHQLTVQTTNPLLFCSDG